MNEIKQSEKGIQYFRPEEIHREKWDSCVQDAVLLQSKYLDLLCPHWHALVEDDYQAVIPLPTRQKYGLNYIYPPFFMLPLPWNESFIFAIPQTYFLADIITEKKWQPKSFSKLIPHRSFVLDLKLPYETLFKQYAENTKRNLKKTPNFEIRTEEPADALIELFQAHRGNAKDVGFKAEDYLILKQLSQALWADKHLEIHSLYLDNQFIGGVLWLKQGAYYYFWFSAVDVRYKSTFPLFFLIDHFIKNHSESDFKIDFRGSNQESLARFYRSFGATDYSYNQYIFSPKSKIFTEILRPYLFFK